MPWLLIASQDDDLRIELADVLDGRGHTVHTAADGAAVVQMLDEADEMPSVLLLDILLPRVNGYDVLRAMRGLTRARHVPGIILSGVSLDEDRLAGLEPEAVFMKPIAVQPLLRAIDRAVQRT
jgi:DNA-binding response OmpR family regulator